MPARIDAFYIDLNEKLLIVVGGRCYLGDRNGFQLISTFYVRNAVPFSKDTILLLPEENQGLFLYTQGQTRRFELSDISRLGVIADIWRTVGGGVG